MSRKSSLVSSCGALHLGDVPVTGIIINLIMCAGVDTELFKRGRGEPMGGYDSGWELPEELVRRKPCPPELQDPVGQGQRLYVRPDPNGGRQSWELETFSSKRSTERDREAPEPLRP